MKASRLRGLCLFGWGEGIKTGKIGVGVKNIVLLFGQIGQKLCLCGQITAYGVERNEYSGRFQKVVTLEELFC